MIRNWAPVFRDLLRSLIEYAPFAPLSQRSVTTATLEWVNEEANRIIRNDSSEVLRPPHSL